MKKKTDQTGARRASPMGGRAPRLTPLALTVLSLAAPCARAQGAPVRPGDVLPVVSVTATVAPDATTEDSGSYAARQSTVAGKTPEKLREIPRSVSVLTRQRMDDQNLTTLQEALRYVTGVSSVDYGDGTAYFRARGSQLGVEFDGVPIVSGLQYLQQFDLAMYDRVEVLRGPAGVMDGAGEPGGTVDMVRKRPKDQFHLSTETQIGSFGSVRQMIDVTGPLNRDGSLRGRAVLLGSDGRESIDRARDKKVMAYAALDYDFSPRTTLSLSASHQITPLSGLDYGASGVLNNTATALIGRVPSAYTRNFSPSWNYSYTSLQEVNGNLAHRFANDWTSSTTLFYRHELSKGDYAYAGPGATPNGYAWYGDQRQRNTYDWFGVDTNLSGPVRLFGQTHTFTIGANYSVMSQTVKSGYVRLQGPFGGPLGMFDLFDPESVPSVDVPFKYGVNNRTVQYGVYAQARIQLAKPLTLVLGGREAFLQQRTQSIIPTVGDWSTSAQIDHRFLPSAGIVWDVTPWLTAYANYARFLSAQTQTAYTGAGLPPRTGEQYEAGLKADFANGRLSATAAVFRINDNNRAVADLLHPNFFVTDGRVRDQGFEFELTGQPTPDWNVYAGYTYLTERYENDQPDLTDGTDPKHLFKLWTKYTVPGGPLRGVSVGGGMLAQTWISRGVEQGGYAIFNAQLGYRFNKHVEASLQVNNLFNRDYYIRPPGAFYSVFGDRRNVMLTVRSDF